MPIGMISRICTLLSSRRLVTRISIAERPTLSTIAQRHDQLGCRELDRAQTQITDINLERTHSGRHQPFGVRCSVSGTRNIGACGLTIQKPASWALRLEAIYYQPSLSV